MTGIGAGAGGADALMEVLRQKLLEQQQMQQAAQFTKKLAEEGRQADMRNVVDQGQLGLGKDRLGLDTQKLGEDTRQFDVSAGQRDRGLKMDEAIQPVRIKQMGAQTDEILRRPQSEQADRDFTTGRDKTQHALRMKEIGARSGDSRGADWQIVQSVNPQTNETVSVRVNRQTGEAQPVSMPGGLQPGGMKQTRLSAGQQDDLATMETIQKLSDEATKLGTQTGWKGVGGLKQGTLGRLGMQHLGIGDPNEEKLRNYVGNIQGTIAKLRGGTAFSAQEKAMLDSYTPTIDDNPKTIQAKLATLNTFIGAKRDSTLKYAGGGGVTPPKSGGGFKVVEIK